jgi:hypothetical protein
MMAVQRGYSDNMTKDRDPAIQNCEKFAEGPLLTGEWRVLSDFILNHKKLALNKI